MEVHVKGKKESPNYLPPKNMVKYFHSWSTGIKPGYSCHFINWASQDRSEKLILVAWQSVEMRQPKLIHFWSDHVTFPHQSHCASPAPSCDLGRSPNPPPLPWYRQSLLSHIACWAKVPSFHTAGLSNVPSSRIGNGCLSDSRPQKTLEGSMRKNTVDRATEILCQV